MPVTLYTDAISCVVIRMSALAELTACLHAVAEPEHHPLSRPWVASVRADVEEDLVARIVDWAPLWGPVRARYLLPMSADGTRTFEEELGDIATLTPEEFARLTAQALLTSTSRMQPPDVLRDRRAGEEFLLTLQRLSWRRAELGTMLMHDPETLQANLITLLRDAYESAFSVEWATLQPPLSADVLRRKRNHRLRGAAALSDFPAATALSDPPRVVFDKLYVASARLAETPCVLVPSRHVNPHLVIKHLAGLPVVIQYGVSSNEDVPDLDAIQRRLAVLIEPTRLAICRAILRRPTAGIELSRLLGMSAPQVSRHLRKLREAGLVHHYRDGGVVLYELDRDAVSRLGGDLLLSLHR